MLFFFLCVCLTFIGIKWETNQYINKIHFFFVWNNRCPLSFGVRLKWTPFENKKSNPKFLFPRKLRQKSRLLLTNSTLPGVVSMLSVKKFALAANIRVSFHY